MKGTLKAVGLANARWRQEALIGDALAEYLMASFPASDPLSMANTLIQGNQGPAPPRCHRRRTREIRCSQELPFDHGQHLSNKDLVVTLAFVLVLMAVLLMLHAASSYSFDVVASRQVNGIIAVPPM